MCVFIMEMEQSRTGSLALTYDEVSMEQSKSFVKALQVVIRFFTVYFVIRSGCLYIIVIVYVFCLILSFSW